MEEKKFSGQFKSQRRSAAGECTSAFCLGAEEYQVAAINMQIQEWPFAAFSGECGEAHLHHRSSGGVFGPHFLSSLRGQPWIGPGCTLQHCPHPRCRRHRHRRLRRLRRIATTTALAAAATITANLAAAAAAKTPTAAPPTPPPRAASAVAASAITTAATAAVSAAAEADARAGYCPLEHGAACRHAQAERHNDMHFCMREPRAP